MKKVVIASNNVHKLEEIKTALDFETWEFCTLSELAVQSDPEEDGKAFVENARIKAQAVHQSTGYAALADDSGLIVDALNGAPGVYSARYAGADCSDMDNNEKLLRELDGLDMGKRSARFICSLVFIDEDGTETCSEGCLEGFIGTEMRGSGGFGYDSLFYPLEFKAIRSIAELSQSEKNSISHRGSALKELKKKISGKC